MAARAAADRTQPSETQGNVTAQRQVAAPDEDTGLRAELAVLADLLRRDPQALPKQIADFRKRHPDFDLFTAMPELRAHAGTQ